MMRRLVCIAAAALVAVSGFCLLADPGSRTALTGSADRIVVLKGAHTMSIYDGSRLLRTYRVALGRGGLGQKMVAGDNRVPEGIYRIVAHNPRSAFHNALKIGYPTAQQAADSSRRGYDPGGDIMIHGIRNGLGWLGPLHRQVDWTKGCIAVTDAEIDEIVGAVPDNTIVEIKP